MRNVLKQLFMIFGFILFLSGVDNPGSEAKDNKRPTTNPRVQTPDSGPQTPDSLNDPVWIDPDYISIPKPRSIELSQLYDILENTFAHPGGNLNQQARNVNTLGEVPDSSWFTNRIGLYPMALEQLARGPNQGNGPDRSASWTIIRAKSQGITPGFTIQDGQGDTYFIKFDPRKYPQLSTSAEVISTKFFYAFGYNVPENYLAFIKRDQLKLDPNAQVTGRDGKKRKMIEPDIDALLDKVPKRPDGTIQVVASLKLPGEPVGPFKYYGTRSDDPNDIFPHEDRRELRGLRVFSAWLNHDDSRSINSLDMYVTKANRNYIEHYLIDFGSTLGSGSVDIQDPRAGNEYLFEKSPTLKSAVTLGLWDRPWRRVQYPDYPAIGRFEASFFRPELWRPEYPNPAFDRMQSEDAFWATRTVMRFTNEMIRALVQTGQISDPKAENYLVETLIGRRDKIIRYYLGQINPLDDFRLATGETTTLNFKNLGVEAKISTVNSYEYQWFRLDTQQNALEPLSAIQSISTPSLPLPQDTSPYLVVRIRTLSADQEKWKKKVDVFIRNGSNKAVVGIKRES
jgi:hypothetical protein